MHVRVRRTGSKRWSLVGGRVVGILWLSGLPDETRFSELAVAAAQEREEPEQMEQEGDHRAGFSPDQSRLINYLAADGVLSKDRPPTI